MITTLAPTLPAIAKSQSRLNVKQSNKFSRKTFDGKQL